eukprot:178123-Pyramimonas_sp.AAC.1
MGPSRLPTSMLTGHPSDSDENYNPSVWFVYSPNGIPNITCVALETRALFPSKRSRLLCSRSAPRQLTARGHGGMGKFFDGSTLTRLRSPPSSSGYF